MTTNLWSRGRGGRRAPRDAFGWAPRRGTVPAIKVEVLYFAGCPNHEALLPHLRELLRLAGESSDIDLVCVEDDDHAQREGFLGSPTVRIEGEDVEPGADQRTDFGLKCRLFGTPRGLRGMPSDAWVLAALQRAQAAST